MNVKRLIEKLQEVNPDYNVTLKLKDGSFWYLLNEDVRVENVDRCDAPSSAQKEIVVGW